VSIHQLNLATRPFRNEQLPALAIALAFAVLGVVTLKHALVVRKLLPGQTSGLARQVQDLEDERGRLMVEAGRLRGPRAEPAAVARWTALAELVDRRAFSWSGLFRVLEETLPAGVRITSILPKIDRRRAVTVDLSVVTRTNEDFLELLRLLEERPEFENVLPRDRSGEAEQTFHLNMEYRPELAPSPSPLPAPSPDASGAPSPAASPGGSPAGPSPAGSPASPPAPERRL